MFNILRFTKAIRRQVLCYKKREWKISKLCRLGILKYFFHKEGKISGATRASGM